MPPPAAATDGAHRGRPKRRRSPSGTHNGRHDEPARGSPPTDGDPGPLAITRPDYPPATPREMSSRFDNDNNTPRGTTASRSGQQGTMANCPHWRPATVPGMLKPDVT